eukprot:TRINITY_DN4240_c0_g2_i3.p1 TRINITY_DN4240_c0_g2~~TRINITY_DN4240_c0_g2_i3.p1  ORF type:complete len:562 (-),score=179.95 TRINITY_DN4240_c0_g2_i3:663-2285(-)
MIDEEVAEEEEEEEEERLATEEEEEEEEDEEERGVSDEVQDAGHVEEEEEDEEEEGLADNDSEDTSSSTSDHLPSPSTEVEEAQGEDARQTGEEGLGYDHDSAPDEVQEGMDEEEDSDQGRLNGEDDTIQEATSPEPSDEESIDEEPQHDTAPEDTNAGDETDQVDTLHESEEVEEEEEEEQLDEDVEEEGEEEQLDEEADEEQLEEGEEDVEEEADEEQLEEGWEEAEEEEEVIIEAPSDGLIVTGTHIDAPSSHLTSASDVSEEEEQRAEEVLHADGAMEPDHISQEDFDDEISNDDAVSDGSSSGESISDDSLVVLGHSVSASSEEALSHTAHQVSDDEDGSSAGEERDDLVVIGHSIQVDSDSDEDVAEEDGVVFDSEPGSGLTITNNLVQDEVSGACTYANTSRANEDRYTIMHSPTSASYYAIYDGHGGAYVSQYLHAHMCAHVMAALRGLQDGAPVLDIEKALQSSFWAMDSELQRSLLEEDIPEAVKGHCGSTVLAAIVRDGDSIILSLGDSKALAMETPQKGKDSAASRHH